MKVNLRKSTKTMLKIAGLMIVLITTIVAICIRQATTFTSSLTEEQLFENRVAKNYNELTNADKETNVANVRFGSYFLRDLEGNNVAHMLDGTCKKIGGTDELYFDIAVSGDAYIDNVRIKITNANFDAEFNYLKDDYLKYDYRGKYDLIEFNRIDGGSEEQIFGNIKYKPVNNYNDYSKTAVITFTADYHDIYTGETAQVEKQVPITVDWYGDLNTVVRPMTYSYSPYNISGNTVSTSFEIKEYTNELLKDQTLLLKDREIEVKIPNLRQWEPVTARLSDGNAVYNPETKTLTLTTESTFDENGNCTSSITKEISYTIYITYPEEAYQYTTYVGADDIFNGQEQLSCKTTVTTHAYNNQGAEFESIITSDNTVYPTIKFTPPQTPPAPLDTTVVVYYEHEQKEISIQKALENYDAVKNGEKTVENITSYFDTHITVQRGKIRDFGLLKIDEDYVKFGQTDVSPYLKDARIDYYGISEILEEDGKMLVYNAETDELIKEVDQSILSRNRSIEIPENVSKVRIELTNFKKCDGTTTRGWTVYAGKLADIYVRKTLDVNALINAFDYTTIKNFSNYYSKINDSLYLKDTGAREYSTSESDSSKLKYNKTEAGIRVYPESFGNNGEIDEDADEVGETIKIQVFSKHEQDRADWEKGEFVVELPSEFNYFNVDSVTASSGDIIGYEYFEENGKKLIRVFAETTGRILFDINAHVIIDPTATNGSKTVKLYYKNDNCGDYYYGTTADIYDVDLNDDKTERIGQASTYVTITSPSTFIVKQMVTNYDDNESFVTAPNVAEVDKESNHATVEIGVKNNNASPVIDCYLLGKILYEGNTKVKSDTDLKSQYTTHMSSNGITVPSDLEGVVVYYSEKDNPNFDLTDESNGWTLKENVTDWNKIKTFLIDMSDLTLRSGDSYHVFSYDVSVPNGLSYNAVSYCTVASSYNLQTNAGILYGRGTEAQKTGIRIVRKYDLNATLLKETTSRAVPNEGYIVEEIDEQNNVVKSKMGRSDANGKFLIKNLYAERNYRIRQSETNINYEKDENVRYFRADENDEEDLVFSYPYNQSDLFNNTPSFTKNSETNKDILNVTMWQTPKYEIIINKLDRSTDQPISGVNFLCYNTNTTIAAKTDSNGRATMMRFSEGTNYTLEEVTAKGYYLQDTTLRLSKNAQYNYSVSIGNNEFVSSAVATNGGASQDLATVELTLYNNSVPTYTLNVVKVKESREAVTSENLVKLAGAEFELRKFDDNEKETITTDENGIATVQNMYQYKEGFEDITGKYGLQEITAPRGYALDKEYIEFVVSKDTNDTLKIEYKDADSLTTIKDTVIDGNNVTIYIQDKALFKLTKTDDDQALIPNVAFVIYELDANGALVDYAKDANGEYVGTLTSSGAYQVRTDANGEITIPIRDGDYMIFEVEAPAQYEYSSIGRRFRVKSEEQETSTGSTGGETTEEKYTYQVQYYYNGQRDDSKTETYEVDPNTEVTTYVDKVQDGYELQYVTKLPYKIECDDLAIDVYYATPKTDTLEINYIEDLIDLQIAVNNGNHYENTKVVLNRSLDFNDENSYRDYADTTTYGDYNEDETVEGIKAEVTSGRGWKSIGIRNSRVVGNINGDYVLDEDQNKVNQYGITKLKYFAGTFDGNNNSISNMRVNFAGVEAYKNEEDKYTTTRTNWNNEEITEEHCDYYNAALFGWTYNATFMNLKFDADIHEARTNMDSSSRISEGVGLIGNSYGTINLFNVENELSGDFSNAGVIGIAHQRINTYDRENTNINVQDVKNTINYDEGTTNSAYKVGLIGYNAPTYKVIGSYVDGAHDADIEQHIEINRANNTMNMTGVGGYQWGLIGMLGASDSNGRYINDTCKMYSITSNITGSSGEVGGLVGYINTKSIGEYKFNNIKSKITCSAGYAVSAIFGRAYPEKTRKFVVENFEIEMDGTLSGESGGVIGYASSGSSATAEDRICTIEIKNGKSTMDLISSGDKAAGIIGCSYSFGLKISDIVTYGNVDSYYNGAGILGYASGNTEENGVINIENVENRIDVNQRTTSSTTYYTGGIAGAIYGNSNIKNAKNYGKVTGNYYAGGIVGELGGSGAKQQLENCYNYGEVCVSNSYAGGILGRIYNNNQEVILRDCCNEGNINSIEESNYHENIGGIAGHGANAIQVYNCNNKGNINIEGRNSTAYYVSGLIGTYPSIIQNSVNEGNISIKGWAHGIAGIAYSNNGLINNVINKGKIFVDGTNSGSTTYSNYGGIVGQNNGIISNVINQGDIEFLPGEAKFYSIAGIAGTNQNNIYNAYNTGNITVIGGGYRNDNGGIEKYRGVGGIVGDNYKYQDTTPTISNCYNSGKIISSINVGGIAEFNAGIIEDCYNDGKITTYGDIAGGIVANNGGTISNTYNVANIVAKNANVKLGPITGLNEDYKSWGGVLISTASIENSHYSDKVTFIGENPDYTGTKQEDSYMRTTDFYDTLNTNGVWTYINGQYPKLMISAGEDIVEAAELNIINDHKVYSISTMLNNESAGTITGYGQDYVEQVRHGEDNTEEIEMIPNDGYVIGRVAINGKEKEITLNDDGSYKIVAGQIDNITEDIIVYVEFMKQDQILTITKVDKDTNETLPNAEFDIVQVPSSELTNEVSGLKESNIHCDVPDLENTNDDAIGAVTMTNGSCSNSNGVYTFRSRYISGRYRIDGKIVIDLTNYTGKQIVRFECSKYWDSCEIYNSNNESVGYMSYSSIGNSKYGYVMALDGGESYYISLSIYEFSSFDITVNNFHVYAAKDAIYNMTTTEEGYFETTNNAVSLSTSAGYVDVDLSNHPEEYTIEASFKANSYANAIMLMIITNTDTGAELYNDYYSANTTEETKKTNLPGGAKYKVEFKYTNSCGVDVKFQVTAFSVTVDTTKLASVKRTTNYDGEIKVQLPVGKYVITETKAPEHYLLKTEPTEYNVDINKENKVTIENDHKPLVRVHHYLMENGETTTKKVAEDEEYEGELDQDYHFNPRNDLTGLSLAKDDNGEYIIPDNYKGKYVLGVTDVNFYYEAEDIKLTIHHYIEGTQTKVAEDEVIEKDAVVEFKRGTSYTVSTTGTYVVGENAKYQELTAGEYDLTSLYSSVQAGLAIDDTLEYSTNAELIYNYNAKKYRIVTRVIEHDEVVEDEDAEENTNTSTGETDNEMTNTTSNEIANTTTNETTNTTTDENTTNETTNTTTDENTTENTTDNTETTPKTKTISVKGGTISGGDLEYYEELASNANSTKDIIVTPDSGYKIKEIKLNDTVIYDADHTTSDLYTVDDNGVVTFNKFNNVIEDKTITVEFEGVGSIVKVHHVLVETGKEDVEYKTVEIKGRVGSRYTTEAIEIDGYTLDSTSLNTTGEIAEDEIHVYYNYKANPEVAYTIRYFYDAVEDTELAERLSGKMGTTVTVEDIQTKIDAHKKDVYEFERAENIPLMIVNDVDEYVIKIYYLSSFGKVTEKHVDIAHNTLLYTETHKGSIGANYNIQPRDIKGFTLKTTDLDGNSLLPTNAQGTYKKDDVEIVTYYYSRNTTVKVVYEDENKEELEKEIIEGHEGDEYKTEEKTIKGYELVEVPKNAEGVMTVTKDSEGNYNTETVVTYKYKKLIPADVIEKYVDVNTKEVVEEVIHKGELDEEYEITPKTIEGYTLMTKDKDGNDILPTNTKGKYTTEKVEVVYYVAMNTTVRVQFINLITGDKMAEDIVIEGYEGKDYVTEPKTFEGYELTSTPENAKGDMKVTEGEDGIKVTEVVVKYYYAKILDGGLPQTSETNSKQAILIALPFVVLINLALGIGAFKKNKKEDMNK